MQGDWLDSLDWPMLALGLAVGVVGQVVVSFVLARAGVPLQSAALLLFTLATVVLASVVGASRAPERRARLLNALGVALAMACISLVASVYANPLNGSNLPGLLFLLASYMLMAGLGVLVLEGLQRMRAHR